MSAISSSTKHHTDICLSCWELGKQKLDSGHKAYSCVSSLATAKVSNIIQ